MKRALPAACILLASLFAFACGDDDATEVTAVSSEAQATALSEPSGGPPIPGCGTAEERGRGGNITLEDAQKLVDACLVAYSPGFLSPTPGPDDGTITFPLKEPATIVIADGKEIDLPAGADMGRVLGLGDYTYISLGDSRIYFNSNTWKPVGELTHAGVDDRKHLREIVDQFSELFPEYRTEYAELTNSYLRDDLPEQATVKP